MRTKLPSARSNSRTKPRTREQGSIRPVALALVCFLLGAGASAVWFYGTAKPDLGGAGGGVAGAAESALAAGTQDVLRRLDSPVEIRFHALLTPGSVPESMREFAGRVDQLLSEFARQSDGRIKVIRNTTQSDSAADAASADGIRPFNLDQGAACFLGLVVVQRDRRETLPQLLPEWEAALQFDLARAIERVASAKPAAAPARDVAPPDPAVVQEVRRAIPDLAAVSLEDGTRILREKAVAEFSAAVRETDAQVKEAEQRFIEAQRDKSEAEQQAASKHLQQVQAERTEKLKVIAARAQARIEALITLKSSALRPAQGN